MSYCTCDCARTVSTLEREVDRLKDLKYRVDRLQRDLEREVVDRQDSIRSVRGDVTELYGQVNP